MSTSHYSSRPAQNDVGSDTMRIPINATPANTRRRIVAANAWLFVGVMLLICDAIAMYHFANDPMEAAVIATLTMPTGVLVVLAALEARK